MKLFELVYAQPALNELFNKELKAVVAFKVSKLITKITAELKDYDTVRNGLVTKYGDKNESGNVEIKPDTEAMKNFLDELNPLLEKEINLDFEKISIAELGDIEIKPSTLAVLSEFITD